MKQKSYGKSELAMLYFPDSMPSVALKRLNRWINNIPELRCELDKSRIGKNSKSWTRQQVDLITYYLGEP